MRKLNLAELNTINGGGVMDSVRGGLSDMKNGFKEGLGEWEGGTNTNGWIGRTGGKVAGGARDFINSANEQLK